MLHGACSPWVRARVQRLGLHEIDFGLHAAVALATLHHRRFTTVARMHTSRAMSVEEPWAWLMAWAGGRSLA